MKRTASLAIVMLCLGALGLARPGQRDDPPMTIDDLAFLAGSWTADDDGAPMHETWMAPAKGNMTGCLRWFDDEGRVRMYELFSLEQREAGGPIAFRLRHFDAEMKPWASEVDGPMTGEVAEFQGRRATVRITSEGTSLERIEYDATGADTLRATLRFSEASGREPIVIRFERDR